MLRHFVSALAALLFALPLHAQTIRVTGSLNPTLGVPVPMGLGTPLVASPLSAPLLSAPSLVGLLPIPTLAPALTLQPALAPVSLTALDIVIPAAARQDQPDGTLGRAKIPVQSATPADGWASRFNFQLPMEGRFFDGARTLKDEHGTVYTAVPKDNGTVRVHILERAPVAATKVIPGTEGLSGKALLNALSAFAAKGHRERTYNETSDYIFSTADHVTINGVSGVVDAYSGIFVPGTGKDGGDYPEPGDSNGDGFPDKAGMNIEHTWPQSLFQKALPQRSDIFHLMATFMHPNSVRGSLPFGVVTGRPDYENKAGAKRGNGVFEPPDAVKGRVARGLLYFYSRHKDSRMFGRTSIVFWNQQIELMLKWNREFPPDTFEARRNDLGQAWQGNRNPFIDDYLLADRVGADALRADIPARGVNVTNVRSSGRRSAKR